MIPRLCASLLALALTCPLALAQSAVTPTLKLELNAVQPADAGCRVSFLATNHLGGQLDRAAIELALFDKAGAIDRLVTLDFKNLSPGKTKVLQFQLPGLSCDNLSRLLINDITACEGAIAPASACLDALVPSTRLDISFGI
jgi:hypothetical protein